MALSISSVSSTAIVSPAQAPATEAAAPQPPATQTGQPGQVRPHHHHHRESTQPSGGAAAAQPAAGTAAATSGGVNQVA